MSESSRQPNNGSDSSQHYPPVKERATDIYALLGNERRRHVIDIVHSEGQQSLSALAREVAAREHDLNQDEVEGRQYKATYVTLYQNHIPKLEDDGCITWDVDADVIASTELTAAYREVMASVATSDLFGTGSSDTTSDGSGFLRRFIS